MLTQNGDGSWTFTRRGTQIFDFNSSGQLADEKDLNGYSTTLSYTDAQLTTITENAISGSPLRTLTVGWDTSHTHITSVTDTNVTPNRTVTFRYNDGLGNLTDVVDVNGGDFNPLAPFGGYKKSGIGRERGAFGFEEFLEVKSIQR